MKRGFLKFLLYSLMVIVILMFMPFQALAHSGRTDSSGGHHDNKNKSGLGSYHYHCGGHPAHLHPNGICPYSTNTTTVVTPKTLSVTKAPFTMAPIATKAIFMVTETAYNTSTPRVYNTAIPAFSSRDDRDIPISNKESDRALLYFCLGVVAVGIIAYSVSRYVKNKISRNVKILVEKESFDIRQQFYSNLFSRHSPKELAVVPSDINFTKDRLPIEAGKPNGDYGKFLVYVSERGNCYHKKCGCSNAYTESHLFIELEKRSPCSRCVSENTFEYSGLPKWYMEYLEYIKLQEKFAATTKQIK